MLRFFFNLVTQSLFCRVMVVKLLLQFELHRIYLHFVMLCRKCDKCDAKHHSNAVISILLPVVVLEATL